MWWGGWWAVSGVVWCGVVYGVVCGVVCGAVWRDGWCVWCLVGGRWSRKSAPRMTVQPPRAPSLRRPECFAGLYLLIRRRSEEPCRGLRMSSLPGEYNTLRVEFALRITVQPPRAPPPGEVWGIPHFACRACPTDDRAITPARLPLGRPK